MSGMAYLPPSVRGGRHSECGLIGDHPSMIALRDDIARAAPGSAPVLIQGPTGAGKELTADSLHARSRRHGQLIAVNVATLPEQLQDVELFGSERGAYTGATTRPGLIERATNGTLFLDEAAELSLAVQAKLLRALDHGHIRRVGGRDDRYVTFRLVLSLQRPATALVFSSRWREDFYYRVAGLVLRVPPLVDRLSDLPALAAHFLADLGAGPLPPDARAVLASHSWPGNVRELRRVLESACFLAGPQPLAAVHCRQALDALIVRPAGEPEKLPTLEDIERDHIRRAIARTGRVRDAAEALGLSVGQLYRRLTALGIAPPRRRGPLGGVLG